MTSGGAAQSLGIQRVNSEEALASRRERIDEAVSTACLRLALMSSVREALDGPWVLDIDASIKLLHSKKVPSWDTTATSRRAQPHAATDWVGNLHLVLCRSNSTARLALEARILTPAAPRRSSTPSTI